MLGVIGRRLLLAGPLMLIISLVVFVLGSLAPGTVAGAILGPTATADQIAELNAELGTDQPVLVQYWAWLQDALSGDLGTSRVSGRSVVEIISGRLPVTLSLTFGALLIVIVLGTSIGVLAAVRGGFIGRIAEVLAVFARGIPSFWLALIAALVFGVNLGWFPVSGYVPIAESPSAWALSLVLPVAVLGLGEAALVAIVTRAEMLAAMRSDYVRSLRANGYPWKRIVFKHIAKNAGGPVLTMVSLVFVGLLGGTILMEQIFAMPGLGAQMVSATTTHDLPVIQGLTVFYTAMVVLVFLFTDVAIAFLNPKVRSR
ncbi:ABC transporter permease [Nocardioides sp. KIGAM211]|uniref:ABC transporter permease n=1 Tax=Nocardioides luti TaxID=2761101 RepID=A0A7X0VAF9_9ACTN|nr:ABC transporter permease [Nocardioides luti]MBB6627551.1 ABC transporter permease [Nocardioides luti]